MTPRSCIGIMLLLLLAATLHAQDSARVVIVSAIVGEVIDREDRDAYTLFPLIADFRSAEIFQHDDGRFIVRVRRSTAAGISDTIILYSNVAISALGEQIEHYGELVKGGYAMGSQPVVLRYGKKVSCVEEGFAGGFRPPARRSETFTTTAVPPAAPTPDPPGALPTDTTRTILYRLQGMPVHCMKNDPLLPRICDTLDAYAWRYYGLIPSLPDVSGASFQRVPGGARLHVATARGDTTFLLPHTDVQLLAEYLGSYEAHTRGYKGGRAPVPDNLEQLRDARMYYPLYQRGFLGLRPSGYSEQGRVRIRTKAGQSIEGALLFMTNEALYLSLGTEEWDATDASMDLYRIDRNAILSIALKEHYSYGTSFLLAWLGSVAFVSAQISQSGSDGYGYSEIQGTMLLMISLGSGIPLGLLGGILISQVPYDEALSDGPGGAQAASKESLLRGRQRFAHTPPPELWVLFSDSEKQRLTQTEYAVIPISPQPLVDQSATVSNEGAPSSPVYRPHLYVSAEYGINMYQYNNLAPRPNETDDKSWSNNARHVGIWLGISLRYSVPLIALHGNWGCIALRPQAGIGMNNVRAGLDVMFQFGSRAFLTAGLDVQRIREEFGFFGGNRSPFYDPEKTFTYHDVLEQTTLRQLLFASVGVGWEYTNTMFEVQCKYSLGKPLFTVGEPENFLIDPLSLPGNHRNFPTLLFRLSWKIL